MQQPVKHLVVNCLLKEGAEGREESHVRYR